MANPFEVRVPSAFEALMAGQQGYQTGSQLQTQASQRDARREAERALLAGAEPRNALARLIGAGDIQGANAVANFGNQSLEQLYKTGMLKVAQQNAESSRITANKDQPIVVEAGANDGTNRKQKFVINPSNPSNMTPVGAPMGDEIKLTSGDRKAIFDAEDENTKLRGTYDALTRAKELAPKAFSGYTAGIRGSLGTNLPAGVAGAIPGLDPESARATTELNQLMSGESIQNMSAVLKGATTDREMFEFKRIMADPNAPPELKLRTIERMTTLAQRQMLINSARMQQLRGGDYFKRGGGTDVNPTSTPATAAPKRLRFNPSTGDFE